MHGSPESTANPRALTAEAPAPEWLPRTIDDVAALLAAAEDAPGDGADALRRLASGALRSHPTTAVLVERLDSWALDAYGFGLAEGACPLGALEVARFLEGDGELSDLDETQAAAALRMARARLRRGEGDRSILERHVRGFKRDCVAETDP